MAPSQFEINYGYGEVVAAADQIQLYKLICRQVATKMGMTASFLPKPVVGVNGNGMHTNVSDQQERDKSFLGPEGRRKISKFGWEFVDRILTHGNDICLAAEPQCERLSPPRSALRSAEPDQSVGRGPRLDDSHSHWQREEYARGSPLGRAGCESLHGALFVFKTGIEGDTARIGKSSASRAISAGQYLHGDRRFPGGGVDDKATGGGREVPLRRSEAGFRRPLRALAGHGGESVRKCSSTTRFTTSSCGTSFSRRRE